MKNPGAGELYYENRFFFKSSCQKSKEVNIRCIKLNAGKKRK